MVSRGPAVRTARAWLELFRLPNAFTIPGDVVAGFLLAGGAVVPGAAVRLIPLVAASLSLYFGGLALNDWFDLARDRDERPGRPLPSGRVSPAAALAAGVSLLLLGVGLAGLAGGLPSALLAAGLALLVVLYDGPARRIPIVGFLVMGLCRGANVLLGASPLFPPGRMAILAAAISALYITAVTAAAKSEVEGPPRGALRFAPLAAVGLGLPVLHLVSPGGPTVAGGAASGLVLVLVLAIVLSLRPGRPVPPRIGALVRTLIPLQAAFILVAVPGAIVPAALVLLLWPLARLAGRTFHGS